MTHSDECDKTLYGEEGVCSCDTGWNAFTASGDEYVPYGADDPESYSGPALDY